MQALLNVAEALGMAREIEGVTRVDADMVRDDVAILEG